MNGKLIVIEGLDGCGKSTQLEILRDKFKNVKFISFPNYESASGEIIKDYLSGKFGEEQGKNGCYSASSFYAIDRFISYKSIWEKDYKNGTDIITARYTTSNAIYQMAKLDESEWDEFLSWLYDYEFVKLGIPAPSLVIFLDMPIEISQKLLSSRYGGDEQKKDIHEKNITFLMKCRKAALYVAEKQGWKVIPCSDGESPLSVETISNNLTKAIADN